MLFNFLTQETHLAMWIGHQDRLSHVQLSPDGMALCTSSWDGTLAVSDSITCRYHYHLLLFRYGHKTLLIIMQIIQPNMINFDSSFGTCCKYLWYCNIYCTYIFII